MAAVRATPIPHPHPMTHPPAQPRSEPKDRELQGTSLMKISRQTTDARNLNTKVQFIASQYYEQIHK